MIRLLADEQLLLPDSMLHEDVELKTFNPLKGWTPEEILTADALFVRTVTPVTADTLPKKSAVRFIATASAGKDHVDEKMLQERSITFCDAGGSNAVSVAEYVAVALLDFITQTDTAPSEVSVGIAGAGHTGSAANRLLRKLGFSTVLYDPPKEERGEHILVESGTSVPFSSSSLHEFLETDVVSLHVPLTDSGAYPTRGFLDGKKLQHTPKKLVVNASRGGVADEQALLEAC
ncbi:NAD(P)-dependent oxidoreductase, partial [Balneolaceae bacterium ANBcel3]|nr:NAD(P)-dependent oxidoreductase [Balneolaceae bacterium ANBcel3]